MIIKKITIFMLGLALAGWVACGSPAEKTIEKMEKERLGLVPPEGDFAVKEEVDIDHALSKFVEVELTADISHLSPSETQVLSLMFDAADIMEELFWMQSLGNKQSLMQRLNNEKARDYVRIHYGPWDRLAGNAPFIEGFGDKPAGANFYPTDITPEEFEALEDGDKSNLYTLIRRDEEGRLKVVWYHDAYKSRLEEAADILKEAAQITEDQGLANYLNLRAEALLTSDYFDSDMAWLDMKTSRLELVYGPIENYEDRLYGYKAAFTAYVLIKDEEWSQRLSHFAQFLPQMQKELPVPEKYKQDEIGTDADLNAYEAVYYRGDCNAGSKSIAINLPNDERVQQEKGSRKLQLKNSMKAKFDKILMPISEHLIVEEQRQYITFEAFFQNVMFHEVGHGMGVKNTVNDGETVRKALKEQYSPIEEAKADIMGLYLGQEFHKKGELEGTPENNYVTFIASIFRSIRFGTASAHGKANMMAFNYLLQNGSLERTPEGQYRINFEQLEKDMVSFMQLIIQIQGDGDYEQAREMVEENGRIRGDLKKDMERLETYNIPVDIVFDQGKANLGLD